MLFVNNLCGKAKDRSVWSREPFGPRLSQHRVVFRPYTEEAKVERGELAYRTQRKTFMVSMPSLGQCLRLRLHGRGFQSKRFHNLETASNTTLREPANFAPDRF